MMRKVTKFNASWQLVRVQARKIKDVIAKIYFIIQYYNKNTTISDKERILNWLSMTKLGYNGAHKFNRSFFDDAYNELKKSNPTKFDNNSKIDDLSDKEKQMILKDLESRTYSFRMGNKIPKDHIEFVKKLKVSLKENK